jgi:hypothetical protein
MSWRGELPSRPPPNLAGVSLRGLAPLVTQVLFGLQQRTRSGRKTNDDQIRLICNALRRQRLTDLADFDGAKTYAYVRHMVNAMIGHVHRAGSSPRPNGSRTCGNWPRSATAAH